VFTRAKDAKRQNYENTGVEMAERWSFIVLDVSLPPRAGTGVPDHVGIPEHPELASCSKRVFDCIQRRPLAGTNVLHGERTTGSNDLSPAFTYFQSLQTYRTSGGRIVPNREPLVKVFRTVRTNMRSLPE
jgi:hypothetical protein